MCPAPSRMPAGGESPGLTVTAYAPATIANVGPGFDAIGLALERPGDRVVAARRREPGLRFSLGSAGDASIGAHEGDVVAGVPAEAARNVAAHVASLLLADRKAPFGIDLTLFKGMPVGSGLGSSAASSVAAAVAVNALLDRPLSRRDLLPFALEGERLASGDPHADNVAPSLLGGACLVLDEDPLDIVSLPLRNTIVWVVVHPRIQVGTREARSLLPSTLPLPTAVRQWAHVAGLTAALATGDVALAGRSLADGVAEPVRSRLIPGFAAVRQAALEAGAAGCSISGSGPSLFAVAGSPESGTAVGRAMAEAFRRDAGLESEVHVSHINETGAVIRREERP